MFDFFLANNVKCNEANKTVLYVPYIISLSLNIKSVQRSNVIYCRIDTFSYIHIQTDLSGLGWAL